MPPRTARPKPNFEATGGVLALDCDVGEEAAVEAAMTETPRARTLTAALPMPVSAVAARRRSWRLRPRSGTAF
jgi:hypothetical protein